MNKEEMLLNDLSDLGSEFKKVRRSQLEEKGTIVVDLSEDEAAALGITDSSGFLDQGQTIRYAQMPYGSGAQLDGPLDAFADLVWALDKSIKTLKNVQKSITRSVKPLRQKTGCRPSTARTT